MAKNYSYAYSNVVKDYEQVKIHFKSITGDVLKFQLPVKEDIQDIENLWNAVEVVLPVLQEVRSKLNVSNHSLRDVALREISRLQQDLDSHLREMFESLTEKDNFERLQSQIEKASNLANPFLIYACESGRIDIIKYLIENTKIDLSFTSLSGNTFLNALCSSESQFEQSALLAAIDLMINKAIEQNDLKGLLVNKDTSDSLLLFSAALIEDKNTACKVIDKCITAGKKTELNLFEYNKAPLIAALMRDDDVQEVLQYLMSLTTTLSNEKQAYLIKETLDYCAKKNLIDYAELIITKTEGIIKEQYNCNNLDIIMPAKVTAYNLGLDRVSFETAYEHKLTEILGQNPFLLEEEY